MVNFTCNTCGDSLKKKEIANHFIRKPNCRHAASLTCFDCLKVFGNDYVSHTICVSEDQRYSANGLKGAEKNKVQVWTEGVHRHLQSVLDTRRSSLTKSVVNVIDLVLANPCIPRKEKQFMNFIRNMRKFPEGDGRAVWNLVAEFAKLKEEEDKANSTTNKKTPNKNDSSSSAPTANNSPNKGKGKKISESVEESEETKVNGNEEGKKKKKSKKAESNVANEEMETTEEVPNVNNKSKKQKKKKDTTESADNSQKNGNGEEVPMDVEENVVLEKMSKKEKKLKKKREKYEAEIKAVEADQISGDQPENIEEPVEGKESKKNKKNKKGQQALEAESNLETENQKKKKRERTVSMAAETDQPRKKNKNKANDENVEPNEDVENPSSQPKDFNWANVILSVLQSQDDKEMPVKRLRKKVINEYLSSLLDDTHMDEQKASVKFEKKLHKTPGVFVHKDKAKLKSNE